MKNFFCLVLFFTVNSELFAQEYETILGRAFTTEITKLNPGDSVQLIHKENGSVLNFQVHKLLDLNNDGLLDIITVAPEACGNWSDCIYSIFVHLKHHPGMYQCVFSEYLYAFEEAGENEIEGRKWKRFDSYERNDSGGILDADNSLLKDGELKFNGVLYEIEYIDD